MSKTLVLTLALLACEDRVSIERQVMLDEPEIPDIHPTCRVQSQRFLLECLRVFKGSNPMTDCSMQMHYHFQWPCEVSQ